MKKRVLVESIFKALLIASLAQTATAGEIGAPGDIQNGFALNPGESTGSVNASSLTGGLPIILATGNLVYNETDFSSSETMGLALNRTYNYFSGEVGIFGIDWQSNFDLKLSFNTPLSSDPCYPKPGGNCATPPSNATTLWAHLPDGRVISYKYNATQKIWLEDKASPISSIVLNSNGTYTLYNETNGIETYDAHGYIIAKTDEQNIGWTFAYDANHYLQTVTHTNGRVVRITWTNGLITAITDPNGGVHNYSYQYSSIPLTINTAVLGGHQLSGFPWTSYTYSPVFFSTNPLVGGALLTMVSKYPEQGLVYNTYFGYDTSGRANSVNSGGSIYTVTYNTAKGDGNWVATVTNPLGRQTVYSYANYLLTSAVASGGANGVSTTTSQTYDTNGWPSGSVDGKGTKTSYTFAANGQIQQMVEAVGATTPRTTNVTWDPDSTLNRKTSEVLVGDHETDYTYGSDQRLASITNKNLSANGVANQTHTTTYTYTKYPNGLLASAVVDGPLAGSGDASTTTYNTMGDLASVSNSLGQTTTYSNYNGFGQPGHVVGVNGAVTDYTYDIRGLVTQVQTYPNGVAADTRFTYNNVGNLKQEVMPDGTTFRYGYDLTGRKTMVEKDAPGTLMGGATQEERDYTYDGLGDVTSVIDKAVTGGQFVETCTFPNPEDPMGPCLGWTESWTSTPIASRTRSFTYDGLGRLWTMPGNNGQKITNSYDKDNNLLSATDALGHTTSHLYDQLNRRTRTTDANGGVTTFNYDIDDRITRVLDPDAAATTYTFDGLGQLLKQVSKDTGTTTIAVDPTGLITSTTRGDGKVTTYGYDALGRRTTVTAGGKTQTLIYDTCSNGKGMLCGYTDSFGTSTDQLTNAFSPEGFLMGQTSNIAGKVYTTGFTYDNMGRTVTQTYPDGVAASYTYKDGDVSSISATVAGTTVPVLSGVLYQQFGAPSNWTNGNGLVTTATFDSDTRLTGVGVSALPSTVVQSLTIGYDTVNRITGITNGVATAQTQSFGYDPLDRLTSASGGTGIGTSSWTYDANGDRVTGSSPAGAVTYNDTGNLITSLSGASTRAFTYDKNGNRLTDTGSNGNLSFHYDPFNRMDSSSNGSATTNYHVDPFGRRIYKQASTSSWTNFVYDAGSNLLNETGNAGSSDYLYMNGSPVAVVRGGKVYWVHVDQLGRPEVATDASKAVVWRASNQAFGRSILQEQASFGDLNIGFPGQYFDAESGLWNNGFRDYDPTTGRYVESDPLGLSAGNNTFGYVDGNPVSGTDAKGLDIASGWHYVDAVFTAAEYATEHTIGIEMLAIGLTTDVAIEQAPDWADDILDALPLSINNAGRMSIPSPLNPAVAAQINLTAEVSNEVSMWANNQLWSQNNSISIAQQNAIAQAVMAAIAKNPKLTIKQALKAVLKSMGNSGGGNGLGSNNNSGGGLVLGDGCYGDCPTGIVTVGDPEPVTGTVTVGDLTQVQPN